MTSKIKQKNNFKKHISENEIKYQVELRKKYNHNDIYKYKAEKNNMTNSNLPIEVKENIITKIINYIKRMICYSIITTTNTFFKSVWTSFN